MERPACTGWLSDSVVLVVEVYAAGEVEKVAQQGCGQIHSWAPRKRIRPLIVSVACRSGEALVPMIAAQTDRDLLRPRITHDCTPRVGHPESPDPAAWAG